jgi:hypothetical protein
MDSVAADSSLPSVPSRRKFRVRLRAIQGVSTRPHFSELKFFDQACDLLKENYFNINQRGDLF